MTRILITEVAPGVAEGIRTTLSSFNDIEIVGYARDGLEAAQMAAQIEPHVLLLNQQLPGMSGTEVCELVSVAAPGVACALIVREKNDDTVREALRAGARAIVTPTTGPKDLAQIISNLAEIRQVTEKTEYAMVTDPSAMPQTIVFVAAKDGVGRSTLAANAAVLLGQQFPDDVVIVDLCGQFSALPLLLNVRPSGDIIDLAGFVSEMDCEVVNTFLERHESGCRLLMGGSKPDPAWMDVLSVDYIARLLGLLRRQHRFVLCNLPTTIWPGGLYAASRCQMCLAVTSLWGVTNLQTISSLIQTLVPEYVSDQRLRLVVNRRSKRDPFDETDVQRITKREIWHAVPNDTDATYAAASERETVVEFKPKSAYTRSVQQITESLVEELQTHHTVRERRKAG